MVSTLVATVIRVIRFDNVTKAYSAESRPALDGVSFEIADGEFAFLIGPSGSGKSTFLELMVRYSNVTKGDIYFDDFHVNELSGKQINALRQSIGYVFQDFRLLPKLTVYQNVAFALEVIGKSKYRISTSVPQVLDLVGLEDRRDAYPHELSGGEQQRVAIARAIVTQPDILILDEPTASLDGDTGRSIMQFVKTEILNAHRCIVIVTHDARILDMASRILDMEDGKLSRIEHGAMR